MQLCDTGVGRSLSDTGGVHRKNGSDRAVRVRLMGEFELRAADGTVLCVDSVRAESLLAYLVLHRTRPYSRQQLAFLLWPDSTEQQARTNLRHVLYKIRRALPDVEDILEITPRTLRWRTGTRFWLDVAAFEEAVDRADGLAGDARLAALNDAVEAYTGDILASSYDDWLLAERERLRGRHVDALDQLSTLLQARGDYAAAATHAERLLGEDPLREATYRLLMQVYGARGDRARAVRTYHVCASTLERELGVGPSEETRAAYEALLPGQTVKDHDHPDRAGIPHLVGRAAERSRLTAAWRGTERGLAQLILLIGEPGIGKTRLAEEFAAWCSRRGAVTALARAHAAEGALAYAPVVAWLRSPAIRSGLRGLGHGHLVELVRLLPELPAEVAGLGAPEGLPEDEQRQRLFDAVAHAVSAPAKPVLLVADDLNRFDRESLRLLHYVLRADPHARLLVVATARLEEVDHDHPVHALLGGLRMLERFTQIELAPLTRAETTALASRIIGASLTEPDADRLYGESEGNPLFLVESLRAGWPGDGTVSPKVQAVIEARLARLSEPARDLVGVAAAIGREFGSEVLVAAAGASEDSVVGLLDELWRRRIIREQGADAYDFVHDKIREVAYSGMSPARRRHRHRRIAEALARSRGPAADAVSGEIARHYERADATTDAVRWYARAADAVGKLAANAEALRLLDHAVELVRSLPASAERDAMELDLLTLLPAPLVAVEGYSAAALSAAQSRALELSDALGAELEPPLVRSLALTSLTRSDFDGAQRYGEQLRQRGERAGDDVLVVEGAYVLGIAAFWQARFEAARDHFELAARRYRPEHRGVHLLRYAQDPLVVCTSRLANTLWFLGRPAEATAARDAALALAEDIGHPLSRGTALVFATLLAVDMDDEPDLRGYTAELTAMGLDSPQIRVMVEAFNGYVEVLDGAVAAGLDRCRRAVDAGQDARSAPGVPAVLQRVLLAACIAAGDTGRGLVAAQRLLAMGGAARLWRAEAEELLARKT